MNYHYIRLGFFISIYLIIFIGCSNNNTSQSQQNSIAYTGLSLIDGVSSTVLENQTVIVNTEDGVIEDIFTSGTKAINTETVVKDMKGKVMMPGLIEGHFHLASEIAENVSLGEKSMHNMFRQGITSVRDMAGNGTALLELKNLGADKKESYPKVYFSCLIIGQNFIEADPRVAETAGNGVAGHEPWFKILNDNTNVNELIANAKNFGCDGLKLYADISGENARRIISAAKNQNFPVWSHGTLFDASPWDIEGVNSFSHSDFLNFVTISPVPDFASSQESYTEDFDLNTIPSTEMQDYFNLLKQNNTILDATLSVYGEAFGDQQTIVNFAYEATKSAFLKGVKIGAGVDSFNDKIEADNYALLKELELLVKVTGMTNMDALKAATINNAIGIGIESKYGSVAIGKKADLIILNENPVADLENLKTVATVVKDGFEHNF